MAFATGQFVRNTTRAKLATLVLLATWGFTFWPTIHPMLQAYWTSGYDYQGLIVGPLLLILLKYYSSKAPRATFVYNQLGLFVILLVSGLWLFSVITKLQLIQQVAILSMIPAIILTTSGTKIFRAIVLPLLCLYLLLPFGENLYLQTQHLFANLMVKVLALSSMPVYWQGNNLNIAQQEYQISSVLYSLKFATIFLTLGVAFTFLTQKSLFKKIFLPLFFLAIPVVFLFVTLYTLVIISYFLNLNAISNETFKILSWLITALALICCTIWGHIGNTKKIKAVRHDDIDWRSDHLQIKSRWFIPTLIIACIFMSLPYAAINFSNRQKYATIKILPTSNILVNNWDGPFTTLYKKNKSSVNLSINHSQINRAQYMITPETKSAIRVNRINIRLGQTTIPINEIITTHKKQTNLIWSLNYINGHITNSPIITQVLENMYALTKNGVESGTIELSTKIHSDLDSTRSILTAFLHDLSKSPLNTWMQN